MSRCKRKRKPPAETKFHAGDHVRVRHGISDVDYTDMSIGSWAGEISEADEGGMYTVRWSQETLDAMHPVFKNRCEKNGVELEEYRLGEDDLEHDLGGPLDIEQPKEIKTKPLDPKDQDDRTRMVFWLTSNDPLPNVDDKTLLTYSRYFIDSPFRHLSHRPEATLAPYLWAGMAVMDFGCRVGHASISLSAGHCPLCRLNVS